MGKAYKLDGVCFRIDLRTEYLALKTWWHKNCKICNFHLMSAVCWSNRPQRVDGNKFIFFLIEARYWVPHWRQLHPNRTNSQRTSPTSFTLSSHPHLPSYDFRLKISMHLLSSYVFYMTRPSHTCWFYRPKSKWRAQIMSILIIKFSSSCCHFLPLRYKYSPQHPALKHPQQLQGVYATWHLFRLNSDSRSFSTFTRVSFTSGNNV